MNVMEILSEDLIDMELAATNKDEAIHLLSEKLYEKGNIVNLDKFIEDVYAREAIGETGMGNHIAIPHGLSEHVINASVAIGKVSNELEWESLDDQPVSMIFLIAASTSAVEKTHLQMLAQLAAVLAYQSHVDALMQCQSSAEFLALFKMFFDEYTRNRA